MTAVISSGKKSVDLFEQGAGAREDPIPAVLVRRRVIYPQLPFVQPHVGLAIMNDTADSRCCCVHSYCCRLQDWALLTNIKMNIPSISNLKAAWTCAGCGAYFYVTDQLDFFVSVALGRQAGRIQRFPPIASHSVALVVVAILSIIILMVDGISNQKNAEPLQYSHRLAPAQIMIGLDFGGC